ncbi:SRPBCC domain-containing protein [Nakamurella sp. A5-74]|uniref:SRPBCC domain-containing protein n=1 Tax=Nakamurella sp. A5-74 TaxID=3158264 RepID=A0AAU8DVM1_9ACTN
MAFPDQIERTMDIARPVSDVWAALTTADGLSSWFGQQATIDLRVGGELTMSWDDGPTIELRVERVDEPTAFGFTWPIDGLPNGDPRRTYVEFTLEPVHTGTRVHLRESGFAQLDDELYAQAFESHSGGWTSELGELVAHLDAA